MAKPVETGKVDPSAVIGAMSAKVTHGIMNAFAQLANIAKLGKFVHLGVINGREFLLSLVILLVCIAIIVLIYYLVRVMRLRGFSIGHSENLVEFMDAFHNDVDTTRKLFQAIEVSKTNFDVSGGNLLDMLNCKKTILYFESNSDDVLATNFDIYFKYYDIMHSSLDQWFHSKDIDTYARDGMTGQQYLTKLCGPCNMIDDIRKEVSLSITDKHNMRAVQNAVFLCSSLSAEDYKNNHIPASTEESVRLAADFVKSCQSKQMSHELFVSNIQQFIDLCVGIQVMNLYFNIYFDDIKELHNSRRFSFFNFLIMLIKPYVKTLIFESIVDPAKDLFSSEGLSKEYKKCVTAWMRIGDYLVDLPATLTSSSTSGDYSNAAAAADKKAAEAKMKSEAAASATTESFDNDTDKPDVVEHMGGLFTGILNIGNFFSAILEVALGVADLVAMGPLAMVMYIIKLIIGTLVGLVLLIIWGILSLPPFIYIIFGIYFFIFNIVLFAIMSLWYVTLFALFALISAVLWVLDLMLSALNGFTAPSIITTLGRCENLPDVWYTRGSFIDYNTYTRAFLCQSPCATRFKPNGVFCSKIDSKQPSYCPQAQVYRIYQGLPTTPNPKSMGSYTPDASFWAKNKDGRTTDIKKYFLDRQTYLEKCSKAHDQHDDLIKTICANWDVVNIPNEGDRDLLRSVCKQAYCDGLPREEFCYKFKEATEESGDGASTPDDILRRIMKLIVVIIISIIVVLMFLYNS